MLRQGLAASEESRNLSRLKRRGKAAPEAKLRPAPRSQSVYVDMSNDVDHIIAKFEDPAKVAAAVKAHDESIRARGEAARQKSAPVEEVEEAEAVEVAGEETPEAVTADGSDVVEDNVSCGEPESCGCAEPEGCRADLRGLGAKGSVVIDADDDSLRARFVDVNGDVLDEFTIHR